MESMWGGLITARNTAHTNNGRKRKRKKELQGKDCMSIDTEYRVGLLYSGVCSTANAKNVLVPPPNDKLVWGNKYPNFSGALALGNGPLLHLCIIVSIVSIVFIVYSCMSITECQRMNARDERRRPIRLLPLSF
jgi:hypothetical protein